MSSTSRRVLLGTMLGFGATLSCSPVFAQLRTSIMIPDKPMRFSRRIERSLSDGARIAVDRSWHISFARESDAIAITGEQINVRVDHPPSLAALADIEEARSTAEMWPVILTLDGLIREAGAGMRAVDLSRAIAAAKGIIGQRELTAERHEAQAQYLADLQRAGAPFLNQLPTDLFYPRMGPMRAIQSVELPGGLTGEFEVTYDALMMPEKGWLERAERKVISRIGDSEQTASENWLLEDI